MKIITGYNGEKVYKIKNEKEYQISYNIHERLARAIGNAVLNGYEDTSNPIMKEAGEVLMLVMNSMMEYNYRYATSDKVGKNKNHWRKN